MSSTGADVQNALKTQGPVSASVVTMPDLACPSCRVRLDAVREDARQCPRCGETFGRRDGIWRFLTAPDAAGFDRFLADYALIRRGEGRGSADAGFYRTLPFHAFARDDPFWQIRAISYRTLVERVVGPLTASASGSLRVLDLGAGNGWLSHRLADLGHDVTALDLSDDDEDGLGCHRHYQLPLVAVQANFDRLPFADGAFDLAVFNASLHYSTRYETTVAEALRVLGPAGGLVVVDTPLYRDARSGQAMVDERQRSFEARYGTASDSLPSEHFLTHRRLRELAVSLDIHWRWIRPSYGWRWSLRPWTARLRGRREPASFYILVGERATP